MKIIVSQQDREIRVVFQNKKLEKKFIIAKADEFLECVDKFIRKNKIRTEAFDNAVLEFHNVGLLTERTVRVIIQGLSFS